MKRGTPDHPKLLDLCDHLKCDLATAVGYLELLWHFTAKYCPQGDIGRYSDRRIEAALGWNGGRWKPHGKLITALSLCHWIDIDPVSRLVIHDWHDHCDDVVRKRLARAGLKFLSVSGKMTGQNTVSDRTRQDRRPDNGSLPSPSPLPSHKPPDPPTAIAGNSNESSLPPFPPSPNGKGGRSGPKRPTKVERMAAELEQRIQEKEKRNAS